ncbi:hypothetical protein [Lysobacter gummosus]
MAPHPRGKLRDNTREHAPPSTGRNGLRTATQEATAVGATQMDTGRTRR